MAENQSFATPDERAAFTKLVSSWGGCPMCGVRSVSVAKTLFGMIPCEVQEDGSLKFNMEEAAPVATVTCKGCLFSFFIPYRGLQELARRGPHLHIPGRCNHLGGM